MTITIASLFCLVAGLMSQTTADFKSESLAEHNEKRRNVSPSASNMMELIWNDELADIAQAYANKCIWGHNSQRSQQSTTFNYVGENLYINTSISSAKDVVTKWDDEKNQYNYYANYCSGICGHYTQVVWANTQYVGCAVAECNNGIYVNGQWWNHAYLYVCNYGPGGNFNGQRPYKQGSTCTECPSGTICSNFLCRA